MAKFTYSFNKIPAMGRAKTAGNSPPKPATPATPAPSYEMGIIPGLASGIGPGLQDMVNPEPTPEPAPEPPRGGDPARGPIAPAPVAPAAPAAPLAPAAPARAKTIAERWNALSKTEKGMVIGGGVLLFAVGAMALSGAAKKK